MTTVVDLNRHMSKSSAHFENAQYRFAICDPKFMKSLDEEYDYVCKNIDTYIGPALEKVMLYKPKEVARFITAYLIGSLDVQKYDTTDKETDEYYQESVKPLLIMVIQSTIHDKPEDVKKYLEKIFCDLMIRT